jgi:hypothetical protein
MSDATPRNIRPSVPEEPKIVDGDNKTVNQGLTRHPWNKVVLPIPEKPPTYRYQLTVQHKNENQKQIQAACSDLEELFTYTRQFAVIDYEFIKLERVEIPSETSG